MKVTATYHLTYSLVECSCFEAESRSKYKTSFYFRRCARLQNYYLKMNEQNFPPFHIHLYRMARWKYNPIYQRLDECSVIVLMVLNNCFSMHRFILQTTIRIHMYYFIFPNDLTLYYQKKTVGIEIDALFSLKKSYEIWVYTYLVPCILHLDLLDTI